MTRQDRTGEERTTNHTERELMKQAGRRHTEETEREREECPQKEERTSEKSKRLSSKRE